MENIENNEEIIDFQTRIPLDKVEALIDKVREAVGTVIVGQNDMVQLLLTALLADGHVLLEGVPGVAKTLAAKTLAALVDAKFSRIQFTPDLMPSDVIGTNIFNPKTTDFEFKKGPIFGNIILIDEINRAPAKTQSSLFEVMEERQITSDGVKYKMEEPFVVIATQNPIEQEGTYRLPEAQLDRFMFKIKVDYPNLDQEVEILNRHHASKSESLVKDIVKVLTSTDLAYCRSIVQQVVVEPKLLQYIAQIVQSTRNNPALFLGASPRASLAILQASKALAILKGRDFITPEDIKENIVPVMRHRIALTPEKEMEGVTTDEVILDGMNKIEVPR